MKVLIAILAIFVASSARADSVYTTITSHFPDYSVPIESIIFEYNSFLGPDIDVRWETPVDVSDVGRTWTLDRSTVATDGHPWLNRLNDLLTNGVYDNNLTFYFCGGTGCAGYGIGGNELWTDADTFAYAFDSNFTPTEVDMKGNHLTRLTIRLDTLTTTAPYQTDVTITLYGEPGEVPEPGAMLLCGAVVLPLSSLRRSRHHTAHPLRK